MGFVANLRKFADYRDVSRPSISEATVCVTEQYARRKLRIKKDQPLVYRGLRLKCIGSKLWRARRYEAGIGV
jgi:hypothetical protein